MQDAEPLSNHIRSIPAGGQATLERPRRVEAGTAGTAAPEGAGDVNLRKLLGIVAQLTVLLLVIHSFRIESEAFLRLAVLTAAGFLIHYFLPLRHRLPFFVLLSLGGIVLVLGLAQAAWLVGLGLAVIGIAHLPVRYVARVAILIAVGLGLAVARWAFPRYGLGEVPWSTAIWPILGSMFVFRLINYLYDCNHGAGPRRFSQTLAYFFMIPNVCFPLFPVVDFKKFCRNYYDAERHNIYQVGIEWIWRGLIQLVFYRLIYYHLTLDPVAVADVADLAVYMLSTLGLYVRISGYFHLIVGMLHLFGFNLPETNHRYFLASSFTDFWRRINIYWKDFMMKVFYYPAFFRLRRMGEIRALALATLFTFAITWFLHAVQWFWIRGGVLLQANDMIFWSMLGVLVLANSLYEVRHGRVRTLSKRSRTVGESIGLVLRTAGTFAAICILWSFWTSESATDWTLMVRGAMRLPPWSLGHLLALVAGLVLAGAVLLYGLSRGWGTAPKELLPRHSAATILVSSLALCAITLPALTAEVPGGDLLASLRSTSLNRRDAEQFQRGYYENLVEVGKFNDELNRVYQGLPEDFVRSLATAGLSRRTGDEQGYELLPLKSAYFAGTLVHTNQWGMRDKEYTQARPPGAYRFAVVGPSIAMGSGVEQEAVFHTLLEERLNRESAAGLPMQYEFLNFGVAAYTPLHQLYQLRKKVFSFEPNAVLYIGHVGEAEAVARQLGQMVHDGTNLEDGSLRDLVHRTGLNRRSGLTEARRRLRPFSDELLGSVYRAIVAECRQRQIVPIFVYFEIVTEAGQSWRAPDRARVLRIAQEAGFVVLDLTGVYKGYEPADLWIAENDGHPNEFGQRLIADRLYALLRERSEELSLGLAH